jgi:hypothetical protein
MVLTPEQSNTIERAVARVRAAFDHVPYPGDNAIVPKKPYRDLESEEIAAFLKGKHWHELNVGMLRGEYDGDKSAILTFVTPEAFQFYLPGFLIMFLKEFDETDVIPWSVFSIFEEIAKFLNEKVLLLDHEQFCATHEALKAILDVYLNDEELRNAERALGKRCARSL